jgi:cystathionine beta-lyase/cystathionine gamma-synthase
MAASRRLQNPLDLTDIHHHSLAKYMGSHSDTVMGALVIETTS